MKRSLRVVVTCISMALVVGVVVAANASAAAPEVGRCIKFKSSEKPYKGKFTDSGCTVKSETETGQYEWLPGVAAAKFTGTAGKSTWQTVGKYSFGCETESTAGEYTGTKNVTNVVMTFTGCKLSPFECVGQGRAEGEIQTTPLEGRVVWTNEAAHEVALDLYPQAGKLVTTFTCLGAVWEVAGSIMVALKANSMSTTAKLKYKQKNGFQEVSSYEEGGTQIEDVLLANLNGAGFERAGWTFTETLSNEEEVEFNTYV
jgi:hypothetical protein